jgi:hypothetical protein
MKIISVVEDNEVIKKILKHLELWDSKPRPPPKPRPAAERNETLIDDSHRGVGPYGPEAFSQLPAPVRRLSGGSDNYLYVDPQYPEDYSPFFSSIYTFAQLTSIWRKYTTSILYP